MWFKNLQIYRLPAEWAVDIQRLEEQLASHALPGCGNMDMRSLGWVSPMGDERFLRALNRQALLAFGQEEKLLPAAIVNQFAKDRAADISAQEGRPVVAARLDHVEVVGPIRQVELVAAGGVGDRLTGRGVVQGPQCEHPCPREWCPVAGVGEYSLDRSGGWRHGDLGLVGRRRCRLVGVHGRCHLQRAGGCSWMGATHLGARTGAQCPDHRFAGEAATADPDPRQGDGAGVADHEAVGHVIVGGSRKARRCQGCLQRIVRRREHERSGPSSRPGT